MRKTLTRFKQISFYSRVMGSRLINSFALASSILFTLPSNAAEQTYQLETLAEGLNFPWSVDFLPSGDLLVAELDGTLKRIAKDGSSSTPINGVPTVSQPTTPFFCPMQRAIAKKMAPRWLAQHSQAIY